MRELSRFRDTVRLHRRMAGHSQAQLARAIGLHPNVLSHKLNNHPGAVLTTPDVTGIVTTLAAWGALVTRADAQHLLDLMEVPPQVAAGLGWDRPPLAALRADAPATPPEGIPAVTPPEPAPEPPGPATPRNEEGVSPRITVAPLPTPATTLIGREQDRAEVTAALAEARLVTLTGPGGTGKTRLALDVAARLGGQFADGVVFVDLAPVSDPALLGTALATALGLSPLSADAAESLLTSALWDADLLLVLDNMEQLLAEAALLGRLLTAAPGVQILVTSRIALRLYGEAVLRVPSLHLPADASAASAADSPAVRLFIARARDARPGFQPDGADLAAIGAICTELDGLALAIELAAARVRLYPPQALLPLLRSRLEVLTGGPRDRPGRQQTLRGALDWSHQLLTPDAHHLFACLGVFAGPFDAGAAAAVSGNLGPVAVLDQLTELADQSMLEVIPGVTPRFHLLQTVREYALARLAESGEDAAAQRRLLAHCLALATGPDTVAAGAGAGGIGQPGWLDGIEAVYPNIRAALDFAAGQDDPGWVQDGQRLATAIGWFWRRRGPLAEGMLHLDRLLAEGPGSTPGTDAQVRGRAMVQACALACFSGDYQRADELGQASLKLCGPLGDYEGMAQAHRFLGEAALARGDYAAAEPHFNQSLTAAQQAGHLLHQGEAYNMLGQLYRHRGQLAAASKTLRQAVRLYGAGGNPDGAAAARHSLGEAERDSGRPGLARQLFTAALRDHHRFRNNRAMAYDLEGLAVIDGQSGHGYQALVYLTAAQRLRDLAGAPIPPAEQAGLAQALGPALAGLPAAEERQARAEGRGRALTDIVAAALELAPEELDALSAEV